MLENLKILNMASAMARHAAQRHQLVAQNVANADTAGYKAKDLEPFSEAIAHAESSSHAGKAAGGGESAPWRVINADAAGAESPNGNNVSLEDQMMRSIEAQQNHEAATIIYKKTLDILRLSLGRNA